MSGKNIRVAVLAVSGLSTLIALFGIYFKLNKKQALVVYCAHDSVYSEKILNEFKNKTGIEVIVKFDTESTKSLGLLELIKKERDNPRCDVFWNNEILGTMQLKEDDLLEPYKGEGYQRIPYKFKCQDGYWTGFASRMRVFIINNQALDIEPKIIGDELKGDLAKFAIAKPLYGTTLTHFCCIAKQKGFEGLKKEYSDMLKRNIKVLNGNSAVKDAVAEGGCNLGWTDTDDFFVAKFADKPVDMLPVRLDNNETVCIPNTVSIIKGCKNKEKARKLVDFLLSEECEIMLANSKSRQIPLGNVDESRIPAEVSKLKDWAKDGTPLERELLPLRSKCIDWLKSLGM